MPVTTPSPIKASRIATLESVTACQGETGTQLDMPNPVVQLSEGFETLNPRQHGVLHVSGEK